MTNRNLGRWLLIALAIVGLAFAAPGVSAHGDEPTQGNETATDGMPVDGDAAAWTAWMEGHMGSNPVDEMESHIGVTGGETTRGMTDHDHTPAGMNDRGHDC